MSVAIFSEVLPLFRLFFPWCKLTVSSKISSRHPFAWCTIPFVESPGIDLTETLDFILLFKHQPSTCFKIDSPTIRVFFLGTFMDFAFLEGSLCGVILISFYLLFLLLLTIAWKLSLWVCEPLGLHLLFSVKSVVESCAISGRVLDS